MIQKLYKDSKRYDLLNLLIQTHGYKSYLEIGIQDGICFDNVNIAKKTGVDPSANVECDHPITSNEFFEINKEKFDLIFVDGLHLCEQGLKDILHSLRVLNEGGAIVVHDCNPAKKEFQTRGITSETWNGDVWKAWVSLRMTRSDLFMQVVNIDHGCGVIKKGSQSIIDANDLVYENLDINRVEWLNLVEPENFDFGQAGKIGNGLIKNKKSMRNIFLDCGSWNGCSVNFFRANYPEGMDYEVFCFEPLPENIEKLKRLKDVTIIEKAVSDKTGILRFYKGLSQSGTLFIEKTTGEVDKNNWIEVLTVDLSRWIELNLNENDNIILKLNVEGAEYSIIEKMYNNGTISYIDKFYIQWHWSKIGLSKAEHERIKAMLPFKEHSWDAMLNKVDKFKSTFE